MVPPASICPTPGLHLASTTTNESSQLVGGFLSLHLPYTRPPSGVHHHQRASMTRWWLPRPPSAVHNPQRVLAAHWTVPPASICPTPGLHLASTTTNESSRLVGGFLSLYLPYTRPPSGLHHHQRDPRPHGGPP